ncbi:MAG TPA: hypothetical protein VM733_20335 [Thermoanaerobaculia bacterium]|nr:hypothetical protein [Thermoanaerobaculia bacterium]
MKNPIKPLKPIKAAKVAVSELNIRKAATRLLTTKLVSTEIAYVQRTLGNTTTQELLDQRVLAVRSLPWSEIALPD